MQKATKRSGVIIMMLLFSCMVLQAQDQPAPLKRNAVYFETFGQGGLYSFNYDYRIREDLSLRAGFSTWGFSLFFNKFQFTGFPVMFNYLSGKRNSHLEAGLGGIIATVSYKSGGYNPFFVMEGQGSSTAIIGTATLGYRFQPPQGGFVFRAGLTPFFADGFRLFAGASVGYAF